MEKARNFRNYKVWLDAYEVETQLLIANKVGYINEEKYNDLNNEIIEIEKQIVGLIRTIRLNK